jgi:hypothetical protein
LCSLVICGLTGCPGPGRQPTAWVDSFASNGASRDEIRKAFLECGASVPGDIVEYLTPDGKMFSELGANEKILVFKCMDRSGFSNTLTSHVGDGQKTVNKYQTISLLVCQTL